MKTITKLGLAVLLFMATAVFDSAMAQSYGGSAYVHVRNFEGKNRVLTTTISCTYVSESNAKTELEKSLLSKKRVGDEYNSQIYYDIDLSRKDDSRYYGGSASVRVKNEDGESRVLNTSIGCTRTSVCEAKGELQLSLMAKKRVGEEFISGITYDIDSCN